MPWGLGLFGGLFAGLRAPEKLIPGRAHLQCFGGKRGETEACQLPSMEASLLFSWVVGVMALSTATDELGARNYAMFNRHAFGTLHVALRISPKVPLLVHVGLSGPKVHIFFF